MDKVVSVLSKIWKPLLVIGVATAATYVGGPAAGQAVLEVLTSIFGG